MLTENGSLFELNHKRPSRWLTAVLAGRVFLSPPCQHFQIFIFAMCISYFTPWQRVNVLPLQFLFTIHQPDLNPHRFNYEGLFCPPGGSAFKTHLQRRKEDAMSLLYIQDSCFENLIWSIAYRSKSKNIFQFSVCTVNVSWPNMSSVFPPSGCIVPGTVCVTVEPESSGQSITQMWVVH